MAATLSRPSPKYRRNPSPSRLQPLSPSDINTLSTTPASSHPNRPPSNPSHHRKIELQSNEDLTYLRTNLAKAARAKLDLHFPVISIEERKRTRPATVICLDGGRSSDASDVIRQSQSQSQNGERGPEEEEEEEDQMRKRVRLLIDEFLVQTFKTSSHSILIDGHDIEPTLTQSESHSSTQPQPQPEPISSLHTAEFPTCSNPIPILTPLPTSSSHSGQDPTSQPRQEIEGTHFTYTAYDPSLQSRLAGLHAEMERLTGDVSRLRRTAPKEAAQARDEQIRRTLEQDEAVWARTLNQRKQDETREDTDVDTDVDADAEVHKETKGPDLQLQELRQGWQQSVEHNYEFGQKLLHELTGLDSGGAGSATKASGNASLAQTVAKVERARDVASEFE